MLVILIRHAQAAEQDDAAYPDDTVRPLVVKGRRVHRRTARRLLKLGIVPDRIFSSPWKRAWQTARITLRELGLPKERRIRCDSLAEPPRVDAMAAEIGEIGPQETIALVGHEPWMSALGSLLLTGDSQGVRIDFPKSGVLGIEMERFEPGDGTLRFYVVP
jgi:phosphohistidine phosphatase